MAIFPQLQIRERAMGGNMVAWLAINNRCNWKCTHCYVPERESSLPADEAIRVVEKLTGQGISVVPATGEITLDQSYLGVYSAAGAKHLLTNGLTLASPQGEQLVEAIAQAGIEQVGFTLNPDNELKGVPHSVVAKAVAKVLNSGLVPTATVVITRNNILRLPEITRLAMKIGFKMVKFNRLIPTRSELIAFIPTPEDTSRFFDLLAAEKQKYPEEQMGLHASGLFGFNGRGKTAADDYHFCPAGRELVAINTQGEIYPCLLLMAPQFKIGQADFSTGQLNLEDNPFTRGEIGRRECSAYEQLFLNFFNRDKGGGT